MQNTTRLALAGAAVCAAACFATIAAPFFVGGGALALGDAFGWEAGALAAVLGLGAILILRRRRTPKAACGCNEREQTSGVAGEAPNGAPIACTLSGKDMPARLTEMAELAREALIGFERDDLRMCLRYRREAAARVREMVRKEQACCAFLDFKLGEEGDAIIVVVQAPERARDAVDELYASLSGDIVST